MSLAPLNDQVRFAMASELADAAACMDSMAGHPSVPPDLSMEAKVHANKLHDHAALLAGSRCAEIYALDDDPVAGAHA